MKNDPIQPTERTLALDEDVHDLVQPAAPVAPTVQRKIAIGIGLCLMPLVVVPALALVGLDGDTSFTSASMTLREPSVVMQPLSQFSNALGRFRSEALRVAQDGRPEPNLEVSAAIADARAQTADARLRYEQARRLMLDVEEGIVIGDYPGLDKVNELRDRLGLSLRRQSELQATMPEPAAEGIEAEIALAEQELTLEVNKLIKAFKAEYESATQRLAHLEQEAQRLRSEISELGLGDNGISLLSPSRVR